MRLIGRAAPAALVLTGAMVSACSFGASPANGLQFQAPPGWHSSPGIMGFMQFWKPPADDREILMLFKSPRPVPPGELLSQADINGTVQGLTVERRESIVICGHQPATYVAGQGRRSSQQEREHVEMVMTNIAGSSYIAMYIHPVDRGPNTMAEAALRELCVKS